jgi:hypothetical protein
MANMLPNNPNLLNALQQARLEAARRRSAHLQIVSNLDDDEEMKNEDGVNGEEEGGIISYLWGNVKWVVGSLWGAVIWIKDLFFAKEDTSGMLSGEEFKRVFNQRLEQLGI